MKLYDFRYGPNLERRVAIDLDRIIFIANVVDDVCTLIISTETKVGNMKDSFSFPSKEHRENAYFSILRASCAPAYGLPTDM